MHDAHQLPGARPICRMFKTDKYVGNNVCWFACFHDKWGAQEVPRGEIMAALFPDVRDSSDCSDG